MMAIPDTSAQGLAEAVGNKVREDGSGRPLPYPLTTRNIVCTFCESIPLNTKLVAEVTRGRLSQRRFPAAISCMRDPTGTTVVFSNGNVLMVGTHHRMDALLATHLMLRTIRLKLNIFPRMYDLRVRNVVCSLSLGHFIDVERFYRDFRSRCMYNPEKFDGCQFYYRRDPYRRSHATTFVIFATGRIVVTGATTLAQEQAYLRVMIPILRTYRCERRLPPKIQRSKSARGRGRARRSTDLMLQTTAPSFMMSARPGPGGCTHAELWMEESPGNWRCSRCDEKAHPRKFSLQEHVCEHDGEWLGDKRPYVCEKCGMRDESNVHYRRYLVKTAKRQAQRMRKLSQAPRASIVHASQRGTRFKPQARIRASHRRAIVDTRQWQPLRMYRCSAPQL